MTFYYQSAACSLHFAPGLQSAFWADQIGIAVSVEPQVQLELEKQFFSGTVLAAMIDVWAVC